MGHYSSNPLKLDEWISQARGEAEGLWNSRVAWGRILRANEKWVRAQRGWARERRARERNPSRARTNFEWARKMNPKEPKLWDYPSIPTVPRDGPLNTFQAAIVFYVLHTVSYFILFYSISFTLFCFLCNWGREEGAASTPQTRQQATQGQSRAERCQVTTLDLVVRAWGSQIWDSQLGNASLHALLFKWG